MKPEYSNGFSISYNSELEEMVITYVHSYPEGDDVATDEVAKVALPVATAREFYRLLPDVLPEG